MEKTCEQCGLRFSVAMVGRLPRFCSNKCRQKNYRDRNKNAFPTEMTISKRWVRADGKRPIQIDGRPASSTSAGTWGSFGSVQRGPGDGYGVMLGNGLGCYDLDRVNDAEIRAFLATVQEKILFVERSVSGTGAHIFIEAPEAPGWRRGNIERYTRARFIRVTGNAL